MKSFIDDVASRSKSIISARISRSGFFPPGSCHKATTRRDMRSMATYMGESSASSGRESHRAARAGEGCSAPLPRRGARKSQRGSRRRRRPWRSRRPAPRHSSRRPTCPEMPSIPSHGSSSSRSSTPHVKAPWEPPPCSARSTRDAAGRPTTPRRQQRQSSSCSQFKEIDLPPADACCDSRRSMQLS